VGAGSARALLLGYYRGRKLVYAGKVGTGFDRDTLRRLGKKLAGLETPISPSRAMTCRAAVSIG